MPPKQKVVSMKRQVENSPTGEEPAVKKNFRTRSAARKINYKEENTTEGSDLEEDRDNKKRNDSDDDFSPKLEPVVESDDGMDDFKPCSSKVHKDKGTRKVNRKGLRAVKGKELKAPEHLSRVSFIKPASLSEDVVKKELNLSDSDSEEDQPQQIPPLAKSNKQKSSLSVSGLSSARTEESADCSKREEDSSNLWSQHLEALGVKEESNKSTNQVPIVEKTLENAKKSSKRGKTLKRTREISPSSILKGQVDVAKLLKLGEKSEDDSSSEDDGWEKVNSIVPAINKPEEPPADVQVTVEFEDNRRKRKQFDLEDFVRKKMNRIRKEIQVDLHKASLVGVLAHGYLVNISLNDQTLMGAALSIIPSAHSYPPKRTNLTYVEKLVDWYHKRFQLVPVRGFYPQPICDSIGHCIATGQARCVEELVFTLVVLCRCLGLETRLVWSLQPLPLKVDASELLLRDSKSIKKEGRTEDDVTAASSSNGSKKSMKVLINMKNDLNRRKDTPETDAKAVKRPNPSPYKSESLKRDKKDAPNEVDDENDGRAGKKTFNRSKTNCKSVEAEAGARSQKRDQCGQSERKTIGETIGISGEEKGRAVSTKAARAATSSASTSTARLCTLNRESDSKSLTKGKEVGQEPVREPSNPLARRSRENVRRKAAADGKNSKYVEASTASDSPDDWVQEPVRSNAKSRTKRKTDSQCDAKNRSDTSSKSKTKGDTQVRSGSKAESRTRSQTNTRKGSARADCKEVSPDKATSKSRKIISSDSDGDRLPGGAGECTAKTAETLKKAKTAIDVWLEIYLEDEEQWTSVDVTGKTPKIHCNGHLERSATSPLLYVVAFNGDLSWKDVTQRYASSFLSTTRKQRTDAQWWQKLIGIRLEAASRRSRNEDQGLEQNLRERPLPTNVGEYKNHPLYALQRHLLKFEAIYPPTAVPLGFIRGEPVYARECVRNLHSRETWLKEAKVVRVGEKPYKIVKARPKWDRQSQKVVSDQPLEVFGEWQVEDYVPPPAVGGKVPRNAYGNVELFLPSMLPKGTTHLQIPGLNKVAKKLGIDCAPAMTGWDYHGGWSHPVFDGFVVCSEHVEALVDAWQAEQEEQERREKEKREKRVFDNWRRLIRGLLIRERLQAKYFGKLEDAHPTADATPAVDADADAEAAHQSDRRKEEDAGAEAGVAVKSEADAKSNQAADKGKKLNQKSRTGRRK